MKEDEDQDSGKYAKDGRNDEHCCKPADDAEVKGPGLDFLYILLYLTDHCELIGQSLRLVRTILSWHLRDLLLEPRDDCCVLGRYPALLLMLGFLKPPPDAEEGQKEKRDSGED